MNDEIDTVYLSFMAIWVFKFWRKEYKIGIQKFWIPYRRHYTYYPLLIWKHSWKWTYLIIKMKWSKLVYILKAASYFLQPKLCNTLYNVILRIARNLLKTSENIKIVNHSFYHTNLDWFSWEWSKKKFFLRKKKSKWPTFQNGRLSKQPILKNFWQKFHRLVLELVGLIDANDIDVAQPIWSWGCLT